MHGLVETYLNEQFNNLHTKCTMTVTEIPGSGLPWLGNVDGPAFQAAENAIKVRVGSTAPFMYVRTNHIVVKAVYEKTPDLTREGGTIDVALTFSKMEGVSDVVLLPMGRSDDGAQYVVFLPFTGVAGF